MNFFGDLFGSDAALKKGGDLIDKAFLTEQEKSELNVELIKAYHPFKKAQRYFMLITTVPYMTAWTVSTILAIYHKGYAGGMEMINGDVGMIVLMVGAFYFGGGAIESFKKK